MEWVDLRSTHTAASRLSSGEASTAIATAFPFSKDSVLLRNAAICSIIPNHDPPLDENGPTFADVAKSIIYNFWQDPGVDAHDEANSDRDVDEAAFGGEDWDAWTGLVTLRVPAPTATSAIMTLPTFVTPPLSTPSGARYALTSAIRSAASALGSILNWTCGVACNRVSSYSNGGAQDSKAYPHGAITRTALSGPLYTQVEDECESELPSSQLRRPVIAVTSQMFGLKASRRAGGWMRVDAEDTV